ncbi:F0F1 ATP synthase subunit delta [Alkalithermobacter paradoxus]|uniref:ATP synthase subunit delta n=1 Tax=Alkalithermobacter paradoxus TaxID=29349 RepID=A0A1V4I5L8_9FIRM|nr:ATP synthase subunit delta, sodium ion specific [[Clostridium] thermoalcaliphilum]
MAKLVATRYANAIFEVGVESNREESFYNELSIILDTINQNEDFFKILKAPLISKQEKKALVENVYNDRASLEIVNFLKILIDKDRIGIIDEIVSVYKELLNENNNILDAVAITAIPMNEDQINELREKLSNSTGKNINLKNEVDSTILGGVLIKMGNEEIDGTLKTKLDKLKEELHQIIA